MPLYNFYTTLYGCGMKSQGGITGPLEYPVPNIVTMINAQCRMNT